MRQILQLGQVDQLQIERVNQNPPVDADNQKNRPQQHHQDVVRENFVVDYREEQVS